MINSVSPTTMSGAIPSDTNQTKPAQAQSNASAAKASGPDTSAYGISDIHAYYQELTSENLRRLVEELIQNQGQFKSGVVIDLSAIEEAKQAISEDGPWGVKAVSDRIVNFAIAVSGDDPSKVGELKKAIDKGFEEARKAFGGTLPDICNETYDEVMRKLDEWAGKKEDI